MDPQSSQQSLNGTACHSTSQDNWVWSSSWCPSAYSVLSLFGLCLYLTSFAPGMGPMPWTINAELYPLWARSVCNSFTTSVNWFFNLIISLTFLSLTESLTTYGTFWLYTSFGVAGLIFLYFFLPETKDKSMDQGVFESSSNDVVRIH
jgi:SP family myo-inositol transporter-like MFS transporter 13